MYTRWSWFQPWQEHHHHQHDKFVPDKSPKSSHSLHYALTSSFQFVTSCPTSLSDSLWLYRRADEWCAFSLSHLSMLSTDGSHLRRYKHLWVDSIMFWIKTSLLWSHSTSLLSRRVADRWWGGVEEEDEAVFSIDRKRTLSPNTPSYFICDCSCRVSSLHLWMSIAGLRVSWHGFGMRPINLQYHPFFLCCDSTRNI